MKDVVLSIQNTEIETLGNLTGLFESDGYEIKNINVKRDDIPLDSDEYAAIIILGGYMSVYQNLSYLNKEQELIKSARQHRVPLLGICLGSQLIAQALGGRVYKGKQKEIGWFDVALNNEGMNDIFKGIDNKNIKVIQWHGDTYDLPNGSNLLASSPLYPQAFKIDDIIGILFHLEVTPNMIKRWTEEYKSEMKEEGVTPADILDDKETEFEDLANNCKVVYTNFSKTIIG